MKKDIPVIRRDQYKFYFDKETKPVLQIKSGDNIFIETNDANLNSIQKEDDIYYHFSELFDKVGGANPIAGPIYIDGAKPGDYLAVEIKKVEPGPVRREGYICVFPGVGGLTSPFSIQEPLEPRTKICKISEGKILFKAFNKNKIINIPIKPFIGTIGVAPKEERRSSFYNGQDFCGNIDCPDVKEGNTVILPVNVEGALLSLGDVHAAQGDGEITGCALECQGNVTIKVNLLSKDKAQYGEWPQVNSQNWIGTIVCPGSLTLADTVRAGYVDLVNRMERYYGFDKIDAYKLISLVGKVRIGQMCSHHYSCVVKIDKEFLE